ncbi:MAG: efflux RND transporter periplasmic adaptor subunit [Nitrospinae bacterium]|nr:efflux RND transporter periplasmic adaptor subunit [Nitrospinota bacterium]
MKKLLLVVGIIVALSAGWFGHSFVNNDRGSAKKSETQTGQVERKIKYWKAPMDPTYVRKEPGKSPMGMDLVPVYESEEKSVAGTVKIDPTMVQNIGVKTAQVEKEDLFRKIVTAGIVEADEQKINKINPKVSGWIEKMFIDSTGAVVRKDEMLLSIYSPELVSTQEEYLLSKKTSNSLAKTTRQRLKYFDVPDHQIRELEKNGKVQKALHIHSPYAGVVTSLNVRKGSHVTPKTILYEITDLSIVWVNADIYEYEIPWVKVGDEVELNFTALPGKKYRGKVAYIYPYLERKSRTIKVRIVVNNNDLELKPEMFSNVRILSAPKRNVVTVPDSAVLYRGSNTFVMKALGEGKFLPVEVTTGISTDEKTEITSGVHVGDEIVTSAQFLIDSESRLSTAFEMMGDDSGKLQNTGDSSHVPASPMEMNKHEMKMQDHGMKMDGHGMKMEHEMSK